MPNFTVNRITPVIEMMKFFATANTPRWQAVGADGSDADVAAVHSDIADYCWYNSNGDSIYAQVIQDSLVKGVGYMQVDVDPNQDRGLGEVIFKRVEPFDVYPDPTSRDFLFRDASYVVIRKDLPREQIKDLFPDKIRQINNANSNSAGEDDYSDRDILETDIIFPADTHGESYDSSGEEDYIIDYYECYSKEQVAFVNIFVNMPPGPLEMAEIEKQVEVDLKDFEAEKFVQVEEKTLQIQNAVQQGEIIEQRAQLEIERTRREAEESIQQQKIILINKLKESESRIENRVVTQAEYDIMIEDEKVAGNIVDAVDFYESRIKLTIVVGDKLMYDQVLPIKDYPIVPFVYQYTGTPFPQSAVTPLVGKQQELNKAHQILIHNANLASNLRWMYEEGSVPEEEWERYSSAPGALLKYRQGFAAPTPVLPAPINNAFFTVVQQGKSDAEYIAGIPSAMMGFTQEQPETYRGLLANDELGTRRLKSWMGTVVEPALEYLGKCFQMMAQNHYSIEKVFRIVQPEAGQQPDQDKEVRINIPIYNDFGEAVSVYKDYGSARFDVRLIAGSTMPVNRWALLEEYFRWFQAGLIDDIAMIGETDIRNKKAIVERKSMYSQMQQQLEQLTEAMKDKEGTIETLERQLVQAGIKRKVGDASNEIRKDVLNTEAQQKLLRGMLKTEFDKAKAELQMAVKSAGKE